MLSLRAGNLPQQVLQLHPCYAQLCLQFFACLQAWYELQLASLPYSATCANFNQLIRIALHAGRCITDVQNGAEEQFMTTQQEQQQRL